MNPYQEIRKVPLDFNGIKSAAYAVQRWDDDKNKWKEAGVVGQNYMLLENQEVKDIAEDITEKSDVNFELDKEFFNGKNFMLSYKAKDTLETKENLIEREIGDLNLGIQFWNSYDGSRSFGFSLMLYRLVCLNGMMSKQFLNNHRFRHAPGSEDWDDQLIKMVDSINYGQDGNNIGLNKMVKGIALLNDYRVSSKNLGKIRHNYLKDIPTGTWGEITDSFLDPEGEYHADTNGWGLLNSATDILWHKEKPTLASYNHNAIITDGLINAVS